MQRVTNMERASECNSAEKSSEHLCSAPSWIQIGVQILPSIVADA